MWHINEAVEFEGKRRWKRNPRWILHMHGRHLASMWGHIGSARQLCFNPKVYPLALGLTPEEVVEEPDGPRRRSKSASRK